MWLKALQKLRKYRKITVIEKEEKEDPSHVVPWMLESSSVYLSKDPIIFDHSSALY